MGNIEVVNILWTILDDRKTLNHHSVIIKNTEYSNTPLDYYTDQDL